LRYDSHAGDMARKNVATDFVTNPKRTLNIDVGTRSKLSQIRQFDSFLDEIKTNQRSVDFSRCDARAIYCNRRTKVETSSKPI
jgi:hypothetical protein